MLDIKNITVKADDGKTILKDISISVKKSEIFILFGPNGSGKSTLIKAIMGISGYRKQKGSILFAKEEISSLPTSDRANRGLAIMFQRPPGIRGVRLVQLANILSKNEKEIQQLAKVLRIETFLNRDINIDLSGGETKRVELFQVLLQKPKMLLLDEPESGVDIENISLMGKALNDYLEKTGCAALIITHTGYILEYIKATTGCVMMDGSIHCSGNPEKMFGVIQKSGYNRCKKCEFQEHKKS